MSQVQARRSQDNGQAQTRQRPDKRPATDTPLGPNVHLLWSSAKVREDIHVEKQDEGQNRRQPQIADVASQDREKGKGGSDGVSRGSREGGSAQRHESPDTLALPSYRWNMSSEYHLTLDATDSTRGGGVSSGSITSAKGPPPQSPCASTYPASGTTLPCASCQSNAAAGTRPGSQRGRRTCRQQEGLAEHERRGQPVRGEKGRVKRADGHSRSCRARTCFHQLECRRRRQRAPQKNDVVK